jgi:hypothetical protein
VTVSVAVCVTPAALAVTATGVDVPTPVVAMVKVALVAPSATVTLAGVVAAELLSDRETTNPPDGAAALNLTVPLDELPPTTLLGLTETESSVAVGGGDEPAVMSSSACFPGLPARSAKMFMLNCSLTGLVTIVKLALVAPAGTVTLVGIVATLAGAGVESEITVSPLWAALNVTVPVDGLPPTTLDGFTDTPESTAGAAGVNTLSTELKL